MLATITQSQTDQNQHLTQTFEAERHRLLAFIRKRIPDEIDAEDLLHDVFSELLEAYRLVKPIAHTGAWMMQVAKNRITDLFRRTPKLTTSLDDENRFLQDILPSPAAGPDALYAQNILLAEIEAGLNELPASQRNVFISHEIEGRTFAEISNETGISINTLLSQKHYAVKRLRARLQRLWQESGYQRKIK